MFTYCTYLPTDMQTPEEKKPKPYSRITKDFIEWHKSGGTTNPPFMEKKPKKYVNFLIKQVFEAS